MTALGRVVAVSAAPSSPEQEITDAEVWEAFRALPLEGEDLYAHLRRHLAGSAFFDPMGDTLDVGAGDGHLWRGEGEPLLDVALARGRLVLSDGDPEQVERLDAAHRPKRPAIVVEAADVAQLPYATARFPRVLAVHVLHWCPTNDALRAAVAELARVTRPGGRAVVVTVDEDVHMAEIYALMREAGARVASLGVAIPDRPPRILRFCAGNAEASLRVSFGEVRRLDVDYAHRVEHAHPVLRMPGDEFVVRYLRTAPFLREAAVDPTRREAFLDEARCLVRAAIDGAGVFRASRRDVLYDCADPR